MTSFKPYYRQIIPIFVKTGKEEKRWWSQLCCCIEGCFKLGSLGQHVRQLWKWTTSPPYLLFILQSLRGKREASVARSFSLSKRSSGNAASSFQFLLIYFHFRKHQLETDQKRIQVGKMNVCNFVWFHHHSLGFASTRPLRTQELDSLDQQRIQHKGLSLFLFFFIFSKVFHSTAPFLWRLFRSAIWTQNYSPTNPRHSLSPSPSLSFPLSVLICNSFFSTFSNSYQWR